jgi:hypothetical protein
MSKEGYNVICADINFEEAEKNSWNYLK